MFTKLFIDSLATFLHLTLKEKSITRTRLKKIIEIDSKNAYKSLSEKFFITKNQIIWAIKNEMAMTIEDVLARRTRCLFLDANETEKISPKVAEIMAEYLEKDKKWITLQLTKFKQTLKNYKV